MSNILINAVMASDLPPTQRHVAMVLASRTDDKLGYCYPSIQRIAEDTGLGERTVQTSIRAMTQSGALRVEVIHRNKTNRYFLSPTPRAESGGNHPAEGAGAAPLRVQEMHPQGAGDAPSGCSSRTPKGAGAAPETKGNNRETKGESPPPDSDELEMEWESTLSDAVKAAWGEWCEFRRNLSVTHPAKPYYAWTPQAQRLCMKEIQKALLEHTESAVVTQISNSITGNFLTLRMEMIKPDHKPGSTNRSRPRSIPQGGVRELTPAEAVLAMGGTNEDIEREKALRDRMKKPA